MTLATRTLLHLLALIPMQAWAQSNVVLELRKDAVVENARIVLADVAQVHAGEKKVQELGAIPLGRAPRIGYRERISRQQIEQAISRHGSGLDALQWQGAPAVVVSTRAQLVPAKALNDAAMSAVKAQFATTAGTLGMEPATPGDVEVPVGRLEVRPRAVPVVVQGGRAPVWLDLYVDGEIYRSVVVRLSVFFRKLVYIARRDIEPGAVAGPSDFELREIDAGSLDVVPADHSMQAFRAARAIRAGQPLVPAAMLAGGKILRGDQVRVSIQSGPINIETAATAMADAAPGESLKVRPAGSDNLIAGRVSQSGTVIIE